MKILWVGDACCDTGFSACTHNVLNHWHSLGHDIHLLGINYAGDPHPYPYPIYPCHNPIQGGNDLLGWGRLPTLVNSISPDVVILLNDPWNIPGYCSKIRQAYNIPPDASLINLDPIPPLVGWLAIDSANQKGEDIKDLSLAIPWTEFGKYELVSGGYTGPTEVVGLGVDTNIFTPQDKAESRKRWCPPDLPSDAFVIGVVGRNQLRKRLDLTVQYYMEWISSRAIDNAYLYLYCAPTGDGSVDIRQLCKYYHRIYGLKENRIILCQPKPESPTTLSLMPSLYSSFDVLLTLSQAEGWWLPGFEAMACGIPVIAPRWSALAELFREEQGAILVPCSGTAMTAPGGGSYTIGGIADHKETSAALDLVYYWHKDKRDEYDGFCEDALHFALRDQFRWENTADKLLQYVMLHTGRNPWVSE